MAFPLSLTVQHVEDVGNVRLLRLTSSTLPPHEAGQFAVLQFGEQHPRPYSVANPPNEQYLEFHIRHTHDAGSSGAAAHVAVGDTVMLHQFGGSYAYKADCTLPLVLIAGGTGLAPLLAIAAAKLRDNPEASIMLYHGGRHYADLYAHEPLLYIAGEFPNFSYFPVLSEEQVDDIETGLVGDVALANLPLQYRLYIAGPVDMMRSIHDKALQMGVSPDVIYSNLADISSVKT